MNKEILKEIDLYNNKPIGLQLRDITDNITNNNLSYTNSNNQLLDYNNYKNINNDNRDNDNNDRDNNSIKIIINENPCFITEMVPKKKNKCCFINCNYCNNKKKDCKSCCNGLYWVCIWMCKSIFCSYCFNNDIKT